MDEQVQKLITHKELIEWMMKTRVSQINVGLLCGCGAKAAHTWVKNPRRFEASIARVVIDIMVRVPGAMERRIEQIGEAWKK
jgi:hypothetical protein